MKRILFALIIMLFISTPVFADVELGGSVFVDFYYYSRDSQDISGGVRHGATATENDWSQIEVELPDLSEIHATWSNEKNVGMFIALCFGGNNGATGVDLLEAYGWWQINPGFKLFAGHMATPLSPLSPDQMIGKNSDDVDHDGGQGFGNLNGCETPQVGLVVKINDYCEFSVALVDPGHGVDDFPTALMQDPNNRYADQIPADPNAPGLAFAREETTIPRLDAGATISFSDINIYPSFSWQRKSYDQVQPGSDDHVLSYVLSLGVETARGSFGFMGEVNWGENWGNTSYGDPHVNSDATVYQDSSGNWKISDTECLGFWVDASYQYDPLTIHFIYGWERIKGDNGPGTVDDFKYTLKMYGISVPIEMAKGFTLRPEFMVYDMGDDNKQNGDAVTYDYGKQFIVGVQFQFEF
jgi:hypothetical protein